MSKKNVQANMKIDVSFVSNTKDLVKQFEKSTEGLKLKSNIGAQIGKSLNDGIKEAINNLDSLGKKLSKTGLSNKEYTAIFSEGNLKIQENTG